VRGITDFASFAPLGDRKYILMQVQSATAEAQTALLKSMEEGTGRSIFFFIIPAGTFVLPTLASRCVILKLTADSPQPTAGKEFLELSYKERLAMAEKFGKDHDREGARLLVRSLLSVADQKKFDAKKLRDLLDADRYLSSSGSSPKSVIGHLALVL
jgi:DNA polymerase III delta prime subunit